LGGVRKSEMKGGKQTKAERRRDEPGFQGGHREKKLGPMGEGKKGWVIHREDKTKK